MRLRELVPCAPPFVDTGTRSDRRVERRETQEASPSASDGYHECERGDENENVPTHWQPPSAQPFGVGPARHSVPDVDFALQAM